LVEDATAAEIDAAVSGVAAGNGGAAAEDGGEFFWPLLQLCPLLTLL